MYTVRVRDHMMIAHSFKGEVFGPAQRLHGATFVVDVTFERPEVGEDAIVVDIGRALDALRSTIGEVNYQNLDEIAEFKGKNTTTEFMSRWVFERMKAAILAGKLGPGSEAITGLAVEIGESHVAWAGYRGPVR